MSGKDPVRRYRAAASNNRGHSFEDAIKAGCMIYSQQGRADIEKTPEPFWVMEKKGNGTFTGKFTAHAQPDFQGTLDGGRSVIFEAKYTSTEKMERDVLTQTQMDKLESHYKKGALAGVCVGIQDEFFFVPWPTWRDMKAIFGRKRVTAEDLEIFRVRFTGAVLFLDYLHPGQVEGRWMEGWDCDINRWRRKGK